MLQLLILISPPYLITPARQPPQTAGRDFGPLQVKSRQQRLSADLRPATAPAAEKRSW